MRWFIVYSLLSTINYPCHANGLISNARVVEIITMSPEDLSDFQWDGQKTHKIFQRLETESNKTLTAIATRHSLRSSRVKHEAQTLIENWRAARSQDKISGLVRLEGAHTGVIVVMHQLYDKTRVFAILLPNVTLQVVHEHAKLDRIPWKNGR